MTTNHIKKRTCGVWEETRIAAFVKHYSVYKHRNNFVRQLLKQSFKVEEVDNFWRLYAYNDGKQFLMDVHEDGDVTCLPIRYVNKEELSQLGGYCLTVDIPDSGRYGVRDKEDSPAKTRLYEIGRACFHGRFYF